MRKFTPRKPEVNSPGKVLARMKDKILIKMKVDSTRLMMLIDQYVLRENKGKNSHSTRTNTTDEMGRPEMTIKVFFKFLRIMEFKRIKITLTIVDKNDKEIVVEETIDP